MPVIYHQLFINETTEKVFDCVSIPSELINWWPFKCSGERSIGCDYNFYFGEQYNWFASISSMKAPYEIEFKMVAADEDWHPTSFGFILESLEEKATKVNFYHKDWSSENDHFKIASFCWAMLLNGLKQYAEKGYIIPFESRS